MRARAILRRRLVDPLARLLRAGATPRELAWSLALGLAVGIVPVLGVSTLLCAAVALALRLNLPAIQLVNYLLTPLQLMLIIPFLRLGELLTGAPPFPVTLASGLALLSAGVPDAVRVLAVAIVHATVGWLAVAPLVAYASFRALAPALRGLRPSQPSPDGAS
jgi:uncharacterized protein (DUF2062 family)